MLATQMMDVPVVTDRRRGAIGVDLNADHLAVAETDASGNYLNAWRVPLVTYGKSQRQSEALIGDAVASVVEYAREVGKPIVIERLDFRQKKAVLEGESRRYSPGCCPVSATARSRRTSSPAATVRELRYTKSTRPTVPSWAG